MSNDFFRETILEHYRHPSHRGTLPDATISHEEDNPLCGDRIRIDLVVKDEIVQDVKFSGHGCAISQATADMLLDEVKGKTLAEVQKLNKQTVLELLGVPLTPARLKCALLSLKVLKVGAYGLTEWQEDDEE
jgi:nitrogen fixation protein NifU and related proteins